MPLLLGGVCAQVGVLKRKMPEATVGRKKMKEFLVRMIYVEMLGHDASFGYIKVPYCACRSLPPRFIAPPYVRATAQGRVVSWYYVGMEASSIVLMYVTCFLPASEDCAQASRWAFHQAQTSAAKRISANVPVRKFMSASTLC